MAEDYWDKAGMDISGLGTMVSLVGHEEHRVRSKALGTLTSLPLDPDTTARVARQTLRALRDDPATAADGEFLRAAVRIPSRTVRSALRSVAATAGEGALVQALCELTKAGDESAAEDLAVRAELLDSHHRTLAVQSLAHATSSLGPGVFRRFAGADEDPDTRFWAGVALAIHGDVSALLELLDEVAETRTELVLLHGNPLAHGDAIARAGQLPPGVASALADYLEGADEGQLTLLFGPLLRRSGAESPPVEPTQTSTSTMGVEDAASWFNAWMASELDEDPYDWQLPEGAFGALGPRASGEVVTRLLDAAAELDDMRGGLAGNQVMNLVVEQADEFEPETRDLLGIYRRAEDRGLRAQIAWAASRAELSTVITEAEAELAEPAKALETLSFLSDVVSYSSGAQAGPPMFGAGGSSPPPAPARADTEQVDALLRQWGAPGIDRGPWLGADDPSDDPAARQFVAYPDIDADDSVEPGSQFEFRVGFRSTPRSGVEHGGRIEIDDPPADAAVTVFVFADGGVIEGRIRGAVIESALPQVDLALDIDAGARFRCIPRDGVQEVRLTAQYFYRGQPAGSASRTVAVGPSRRPDVSHTVGWRLQLLEILEDELPPDLTLVIQRDRVSHEVQFTIAESGASVGRVPGPTPIERPEALAKRLQQDLGQNGYAGPLAADSLRFIGERVAELLPADWWRALRARHVEIERTPRVLIITNEMQIPWELAWLPEALDPDAEPHLGCQVDLARWLLQPGAPGRPTREIPVRKVTTIGARFGFDDGADQAAIPEAWREARDIASSYGGTPVYAKEQEVTAVLTAPLEPGHLLHIAVHGLSDPERSHDAALLLIDGTLPSSSLAGGRTVPPRFQFVFLNACQVGTTQVSLGQAAGFAPDLIRSGTSGFVAPLWNVHSEDAKQLAERFYASTLAGGGTLSSALREARSTYDRSGTTAPIAYVYYGHPAATLRRSNIEELAL